MNLNSMLGDARPSLTQRRTVQEFAFQAGAPDADTHGCGGGRLNVVPKDGGNTLRGSAFLACNADSWQADNSPRS